MCWVIWGQIWWSGLPERQAAALKDWHSVTPLSVSLISHLFDVAGYIKALLWKTLPSWIGLIEKNTNLKSCEEHNTNAPSPINGSVWTTFSHFLSVSNVLSFFFFGSVACLVLVELEGFQGMLARSDFIPVYSFFSSSAVFPSLLYFLLLYKLRGVDSWPLTQNQALEEQPDN